MKKLTKDELDQILRLHEAWVHSGGTDGARADLSNTDLSDEHLAGVNLRRANLSNADLRGADLRATNLSRAVLTRALLSCASLSHSDLSFADLRGARIRYANLQHAIMHHADFEFAALDNSDLIYAYLCGANLHLADLRGVNLRDARLDDATIDTTTRLPFIPLVCPDTGSFIAWKGCVTDTGTGCVVKLQIPEDALRSSSTGRKCRCSSAIVLEIQKIDGTILTLPHGVHSYYDPDFRYVVGDTIIIGGFDENRFNECSRGIHFFITREEAVQFSKGF